MPIPQRILFSNLGYARGIDGRLLSHLRGARQYVNSPPAVQRRSLDAFRALLHQHQVDLCCIAEIDAGSSNNQNFDQMHFLKDAQYPHGYAVNKYGREYALEKITVSKGKSNGFLSKIPVEHRVRFLSHGTKRLVCQLALADGLSLWFGHFSLRPWVRKKQFGELAGWLTEEQGEVLLLGDFNNYHGIGELRALTEESGLRLLNPKGARTFRLGLYQTSIDLALATKGLAGRCRLQVIPQPFSDHEALLVEIT